MAKPRHSPRKTPTQARAKRTWNAILDGAAQVLIRQGYEKATTDRIAERTGVSVGTIYEYFPNKDAVYAALSLRWNDQRWSVFQASIVAAPDDNLQTALRATVRARIAATSIDAELNTALANEVPGKVTAHQAREIHDEFLEVSVANLTRFKAEIRSQDFTVMAKLMMHATHAIVDNIASSEPELLSAPLFEDELVHMMHSYICT